MKLAVLLFKHQDGNDQLSLEETVDLGPPDEGINISKTGFGENNKEKVMSASIIDQGINNFHSFEQVHIIGFFNYLKYIQTHTDF